MTIRQAGKWAVHLVLISIPLLIFPRLLDELGWLRWVLTGLGLLSFIGAAVLIRVNLRCPYCRAPLWGGYDKAGAEFCSRCGEKIDYDTAYKGRKGKGK